MLGSFGSVSLINYAFGLIAGWLLLPSDFGLLAFTQAILLLSALVLNSGFAWALMDALVEVAPAQRGALIRGALFANLLLAMTLGLAMVLLFTLGPLERGLETWTMVVLVVLALLCLALVAIARAALQGLERFSAVALLQVIEVVIKAGSGVLLMRAEYGAPGGVAGFLIGAAITALAGLALLYHAVGVRPWGAWERPAMRTATAMFAVLIGMALLLQVDILALKLWGSDRTAVGWYQAGIALANAPYYLSAALIPILFTKIKRAPGLHESGPSVIRALRLVLLTLIPIEIVLALAPAPVLGLLFPAAYQSGHQTLPFLALGNSAIMLVGILTTAFQAIGQAGRAARLLMVVIIAEIVVLSIAVPRFQALGAATAFAGASVVALVALSYAYYVVLGRPTLVQGRDWLLKYCGALGLAICGARILAVVGSPLLLALGGGGVCYGVAILGLRLIRLPVCPGWTSAHAVAARTLEK